MEPDTAANLFLPLFKDMRPGEVIQSRPLLAHYTSLETLESIVSSNELWFSNPLFMNDLDEVKFGILNGVSTIKTHEQLQHAIGSDNRRHQFNSAVDRSFQEFERDHVFDTYVFCCSEHDPENGDGLLSMWRGYGGNGKGVAIIFDSSKIDIVRERRPLVIARVQYGTSAERFGWLNLLCDQAAAILTLNEIPDNHLGVAASVIFERIKLFALFTKHGGFKEEREWRVVYRREIDYQKSFDRFFSYCLGPAGVEPKLKLKLEPMEGVTSDNLSFEQILFAILLGPTSSSVLALTSVRRMLQLKGRPEAAKRVFASSIPLRPSNSPA